MMPRAGFLFLILAALLTACEKPEPVPVQVGAHQVSIIVPADWEHFDYGEQHQWRKDFERIALQDMGRQGRHMELAVKRALEKLREDERRETASLDTLTINGREAVMVDTWDHVSHQYRKRFLFVINGRNLLVMYTMQGRFELMEPAFTEMATSLAFIDTTSTDGDQPQ